MYQESKELFHVETSFANNAYHRSYDPLSTQLYRADFTAFRQINDRSFFSTTISYDEYNQHDIFASMEKDFYDASKRFVKSIYIRKMLGEGENIGKVISFLNQSGYHSQSDTFNSI